MKKLDANTPKLPKILSQLRGSGASAKVPPKVEAQETQQQQDLTSMPSKATLAAQNVVTGQVEQKAEKKATAATLAAQVSAGVLAGVGLALRKAVAAAVLTTTLLYAPQAQTVFLDHNDAQKEIAVAQQLAASKNEPFVLVRADSASVENVFARAERGEMPIRHLILSGHSVGYSVWGFSGSSMRETTWEQLRALKLKYPTAFEQVKHLHFMSCYSASAGQSAQWSAIFPNAMIAGFWGFSPSKQQVAAGLMLQNSEVSMRKLDGRDLSPQQALVAAKAMARQPGSNVTKFAVRLPTNDGASVHFALGEPKTSLDVALDRVELLRARSFDGYMNPEGAGPAFASPPSNHRNSPLRDYYNALHTYMSALPPDHDDVKDVQNQLAITIRLIYFDAVQEKMQAVHGATFAAADSVLKEAGIGVSIGDVSKLTRLQVVQLVNSLKELGDIPWLKFGEIHAADLAIVDAYVQSTGEALSRIILPTPRSARSEGIGSTVVAAQAVADFKSSPQKVKDAAQRLVTALNDTHMKGNAPALQDAMELLDHGLNRLSPRFVPSTWIE